MNDFPHKPQFGQSGDADPQFGQPHPQPHPPQQPQYDYDPNQQQYAHPAQQYGYEQPYEQAYGEPEPEPEPQKPNRKIYILMAVFCLALVGGTVALLVFKDQIQIALGKKEAAKEEAEKEERKAAAGEAFMNDETGDYIAAEESNVPVEASAEWKRRYEEGKNKHGVFYVPIATVIAEQGAPGDESPVLERDDFATAPPKKSVAALKTDSFEGNSTDEWRGEGGCSVVVIGDAAKEGSKSLLVSDRRGQSSYPTRDLSTTLTKDKLFRFSAFVQLKDKVEADMKLVVVVNDGSGEQQQIVVKKKVNNEKFTQLSGDFSLAAASPLSVKLALVCNDDSASFYVDDVSAKPSL